MSPAQHREAAVRSIIAALAQAAKQQSLIAQAEAIGLETRNNREALDAALAEVAGIAALISGADDGRTFH